MSKDPPIIIGSSGRPVAINAKDPPMTVDSKDRPIVISGGSPLVIKQLGAKLQRVNRFTAAAGDARTAVTYVMVNSTDGGMQWFQFRHDQCDITFSFGGHRFSVQTDQEGRNLRIVSLGGTPLKLHLPDERGERTIEGLEIRKAGVRQRVARPRGHTDIVIHNWRT